MARVNPSLYIASQYMVVFGRMPDPEGFRYWRQVASDGLIPLSDIVHEFVVNAGRAEFDASYGGKPFAEQLDILYTRLFNRGVDAEGLAYWQAQIDAGRSLWEVFRDVVWAAWHRDHRSEDWKTIHNKASLAMDMALWLNEPHELARWREVAEWSGPFLQAVTADPVAYWDKLGTLQMRIDEVLGHQRPAQFGDDGIAWYLPPLRDDRKQFEPWRDLAVDRGLSSNTADPVWGYWREGQAGTFTIGGSDWKAVYIDGDRVSGPISIDVQGDVRFARVVAFNSDSIPNHFLRIGKPADLMTVSTETGHSQIFTDTGIVFLGEGHDVVHPAISADKTARGKDFSGSRPEDFAGMHAVLVVFGFEPGRDVFALYDELWPNSRWEQHGNNAVFWATAEFFEGLPVDMATVFVGLTPEQVTTAFF